MSDACDSRLHDEKVDDHGKRVGHHRSAWKLALLLIMGALDSCGTFCRAFGPALDRS
jgi:hypothetical protein